MQDLARWFLTKIKQDHLASTCKINGKQDQARDLVRISKIKQDWSYSRLSKIKQDQARKSKIDLLKIKQDWAK